MASTYGGKAFEVAKMAQVTGKRWPIVGKRLVSEFPYIEGEVTHHQLFTTQNPMDNILYLQTQ